MSLSINSNPLASNAGRNLSRTSELLSKVQEQIASGKRINSAADDAAGMSIYTKLKSQHGSWSAVESNIGNANSLLTVADTALGGQAETLTRMRELAVKASSDLLDADSRAALGKEFVELQSSLDEQVNRASLFGQNLVSSGAAAVDIQTGINSGDKKTITIAKSDAATLGVDAATIDLTDKTKAAAAITAIDTAVGTVSNNQATIGSQMNSLTKTNDFVGSLKSSLEKSMSAIMDAPMEELSTQLATLQSKQQLGISMLGLINQNSSMALGLLR